MKFGWICKAKLGTLDEDQKVIGDVLFDGVGEEVTCEEYMIGQCYLCFTFYFSLLSMKTMLFDLTAALNKPLLKQNNVPIRF